MYSAGGFSAGVEALNPVVAVPVVAGVDEVAFDESAEEVELLPNPENDNPVPLDSFPPSFVSSLPDADAEPKEKDDVEAVVVDAPVLVEALPVVAFEVDAAGVPNEKEEVLVLSFAAFEESDDPVLPPKEKPEALVLEAEVSVVLDEAEEFPKPKDGVFDCVESLPPVAELEAAPKLKPEDPALVVFGDEGFLSSEKDEAVDLFEPNEKPPVLEGTAELDDAVAGFAGAPNEKPDDAPVEGVDLLAPNENPDELADPVPLPLSLLGADVDPEPPKENDDVDDGAAPLFAAFASCPELELAPKPKLTFGAALPSLPAAPVPGVVDDVVVDPNENPLVGAADEDDPNEKPLEGFDVDAPGALVEGAENPVNENPDELPPFSSLF